MQYPNQFWDDRYGQSEFVYGVQPNEFFKEKISAIAPPGRLLLLAEGEGRNAVFAAKLGWQVTAIDFSENGRRKALGLASQNGAQLDYQVMDVQEFDFEKNNDWDAIGLIYSHFPAHFRGDLFKKCLRSLRPGGSVILELFTPEQLNYTSGGPKDLSLLYSAEQAHADFAGAASLEIGETIIYLQEGAHHQGPAAVVRCVAVR
ncbi:MAG: methyltransferase domain-containing protein [Saprospiraceae bacterium]|nr:methyltransferase domain-containing protein [Saprospiraceae bacterium]